MEDLMIAAKPFLNGSITMEQALVEKIQYITNNANKWIDKNNTKEDISTAEKSIKVAVQEYNDLVRHMTIERYAEMDSKAVWMEYFENQASDGMVVIFSREHLKFRVERSSEVVYNHPYDVIRILSGSTWETISAGIRVFADNCIKFALKKDGVTVTKTLKDSSYNEIRRRFGWQDYSTLGSLSKQLSELLRWIIPDIEIKAINADVKYIISSIYRIKDEKTRVDAHIMRETATLVNCIFRAAYTRYHRFPYPYQEPK